MTDAPTTLDQDDAPTSEEATLSAIYSLLALTMRYPADGPDAVEGANRSIDELIRRIEPPVFRSRKDVRKRNKKRL